MELPALVLPVAVSRGSISTVNSTDPVVCATTRPAHVSMCPMLPTKRAPSIDPLCFARGPASYMVIGRPCEYFDGAHGLVRSKEAHLVQLNIVRSSHRAGGHRAGVSISPSRNSCAGSGTPSGSFAVHTPGRSAAGCHAASLRETVPSINTSAPAAAAITTGRAAVPETAGTATVGSEYTPASNLHSSPAPRSRATHAVSEGSAVRPSPAVAVAVAVESLPGTNHTLGGGGVVEGA
mmetsp:Transcript_14698/g.37763  ORF Transcript_14698/g.37763 Transcript_14698/m.37763 type:complete len:236 (+) Transcript_14698:2115-2822(+)